MKMLYACYKLIFSNTVCELEERKEFCKCSSLDCSPNLREHLEQDNTNFRKLMTNRLDIIVLYPTFLWQQTSLKAK